MNLELIMRHPQMVLLILHVKPIVKPRLKDLNHGIDIFEEKKHETPPTSPTFSV